MSGCIPRHGVLWALSVWEMYEKDIGFKSYLFKFFQDKKFFSLCKDTHFSSNERFTKLCLV